MVARSLKKQMGNKKDASRDLCAQIACREWIDVRAFGQVLHLKEFQYHLAYAVRCRFIRQ